MATMTTGSLTQLWTQDFKKIFFGEHKRVAPTYSRYCNVSNETKEHYIKEGYMVSLGAGQEMHQSEAIPFDEFLEGPEKTVYFNTYGLGVQSSLELLEDDRVGYIKRAIAELGKSAAYTRELKAADLLNSAFVTTNRSGIDSKALIASDHPLYGPDGGTFSNLVSGSLSKTTLRSAMDVFASMVNDRSIPLESMPKVLHIPYQLRWLAEEYLDSSAELDPENANNTINTLNNKGLTWYVNRYLTSSTAWFLTGANHDLRWINRRPVTLSSEIDFNTDNRIWKYTFRALATFFHWRDVVGSTGT